MNNVKFSIIIPVYNTKIEFLNACMESVLQQTYKNYEIIIIDDGSNKQTKLYLDRYNDKATILHQKNSGISASRISGLKVASGDYIIHLDSDDILNINSLTIINNIIEKYDSDVIIQDPSRFYNTIDKIEFRNTYFSDGVQKKDDVIRELCKLHINSICNKFVKKSLYNDLEKHIDTSFINGEDLQQSTYVVLKANSFFYTSEPIYYYRLNEEPRDYYKTINLNDVNYTIPTYNMLFMTSHEYDDYLPIFKLSTLNYVIYTAFKICSLYKKADDRKEYLDELNKQPIVTVASHINAKLPLISSVLFFLLYHKWYFLLFHAATLYKLTFGFDKATFR